MKLYQKITWKFLQLTFGNYCKWILKLTCNTQNTEPDDSYILLGNHAHHIDAFFIATYLKKPLHFLGSDEIASTFQQILGKLVGIVYTKKGTIDPVSVRELFKHIRNNGSIGIYPEGDGTWDGETDKIFMNIIKLIRKFNRPIRLARLTGAYLTKPRWGESLAKGKIFLEFKNITLAEINKFYDQELFDNIVTYLYNNDVKDERLAKINFRIKNRARGIQYILWKCPVCGKVDSIIGDKNKFHCRNCHENWEINGNMKIFPKIDNIKDIKEFNDWQKKEIIQSINSNHDILTMSEEVNISVFKEYSKGINKKKMLFYPFQIGQLILYFDKLVFKSKNSDFQILFYIDRIKYYAECVNQFFLIHYEDKIYKINFNNNNSSRYIYYFRYLNGYYDGIKINRNNSVCV